MIGDPAKVLERARALGKEGRAQLALHLVDLVIDSNDRPGGDALELKIELLKDLAEKERSLIARNIFLGGIRQIEKATGPK